MYPNNSDYLFNQYEDRLNTARKKYELGELSNLSDQFPLAPLSPIDEARYKKANSSCLYFSDKVQKDGIADILLIGDVMCRYEQQKSAIEKYGLFDFRDMFPYVTPLIARHDFVACNLETTLAESAKYTYELNRNDHTLNRNSPSTLLHAVRELGVDLTVTANNHCLDGGLKGIYQTICHLEQYQLLHTGTFFDLADRKSRPFLLVDIDGIKVAFVSYTYGTNHRSEKIEKAARRYFVNLYRPKRAEKDISLARAAGAEFVVAYIHWGVEFSHNISEKQFVWAKELADAGADFIAGSHPHVVEPFSYVENARGQKVPVIFSMGNFISSMARPERRDSVAINLQLERKNNRIQIKAMEYIPFYTCISYEQKSYTTVPLSDKLCEENPELREAKNRIALHIGREIEESSLTRKKPLIRPTDNR